MKMQNFKKLTGIIFLSLTFWLAGCGSKSTSSNTSAPETTATALTMGASLASIRVNGTDQFTASGGTAPYTYSIVSGGGTINSSTGSYSAPSQAASVAVRVTDAANATYDVTISVTTSSTSATSTLTLVPAASSVSVNNTVLFSAGGGVAPYTFSIISGGGSIGSISGILTAPSSTGFVEVQAKDSIGTTANYTISVKNGSSTTSGVTLCQGTYSLNSNGTLGTLTLVEDSSSGKIAGSLAFGTTIYSVEGLCDLASTGTIYFNRLGSTQSYTGTFFVNSSLSSQIVMSGNYLDSSTGTPYPWMAITK